MTLVFSIAALVFNISEGKADQWINNGKASSVITLSMGNNGAIPKSYENNELIIQAYLNFGVILIILILINILRRRQNILIHKIDKKNITPPDFTVYAMNLPLDKNEKEVAKWFDEYDPNNPLKISKINY